MSARSTKTTLTFGLVECDLALYRVTGEPPKPAKFEKAGPNGGKLERPVETSAAVTAAVPEEAPKADPLADAEDAFAEAVEAELVDEPYWLEEGTGERVDRDDIRRGIREDDRFVDLTTQLDAIAERTQLDEMRVADFIRTEEIRRERIVGAYYIAPDGEGAGKVLALLHRAMRETKRVAVVKFTKRTKQTLAVLVPHPPTGSLMLIEMAWAEDVREAPAKCHAPASAQVTQAEVDTTVRLIEAMSSSRASSLDAQEDDSRRLVRELVESVQTGRDFSLPARPEVEREGADVIDLLERGLREPEELRAAAA